MLRRLLPGVGAIALLLCLAPAWAADPGDVDAVPHLDNAGRAAYLRFLNESSPHKAFAVAPGGEWGLADRTDSVAAARAKALEICRRYSRQPCHIYAEDGGVVFDRAAFDRSWVDLSRQASTKPAIGAETGKRFPDIAFKDASGRSLSLSDFKGRPVFLHFWGSWCGPCRVEFLQLQQLYRRLAGSGVAFVLVQARESIEQSRVWAERNGFDLPLYDSGAKGKADCQMATRSGERLDDRDLAPGFPSTFILDRAGVVVFVNEGPNKDWLGYMPLLASLDSTE